jgi:hypothetical protein
VPSHFFIPFATKTGQDDIDINDNLWYIDERATDLIQSFTIREPVKRSDRGNRIALLLEPQMEADRANPLAGSTRIGIAQHCHCPTATPDQ